MLNERVVGNNFSINGFERGVEVGDAVLSEEADQVEASDGELSL